MITVAQPLVQRLSKQSVYTFGAINLLALTASQHLKWQNATLRAFNVFTEILWIAIRFESGLSSVPELHFEVIFVELEAHGL